MPKKLQKSLQDYLYKVKNPTPNNQFPSNNPIPSSKSWILRGCKHPKTLSFAIDGNQKESHDGDGGHNKNEAATLSDVDRFLFENFRSLYINDDEEDQGRHQDQSDDDHHINVQNPNGILFDSPRFLDPPQLAHLRGSNRFFVAPGSSGSLIGEARASLTTATSEDMGSSSNSTHTFIDSSATSNSNDLKHVALPEDSIAVITYSPCPYSDFRRSMQEMVEERLQVRGEVDWDFMEELLLCYLNLNEKKSHKFILPAFVDLIVSLRQNSSNDPERSHHSRIARERRRRMKNVAKKMMYNANQEIDLMIKALFLSNLSPKSTSVQASDISK